MTAKEPEAMGGEAKVPDIHFDPSTGRGWALKSDYDALAARLADAEKDVERLTKLSDALKESMAINRTRAAAAESQLAALRAGDSVVVPREPTVPKHLSGPFLSDFIIDYPVSEAALSFYCDGAYYRGWKEGQADLLPAAPEVKP